MNEEELVNTALNRAWDYGILGVVILAIFGIVVIWLWRYHIPNRLREEEHRRAEDTKSNEHQRTLENTRAKENREVMAAFAASITEATAILKQLKENDDDARRDRSQIKHQIESVKTAIDKLI